MHPSIVRALVLAASILVLAGCSGQRQLDELSAGLATSEPFREIRGYSFEVGRVPMDEQRGDEYEDLLDMGVIRIAGVDRSTRSVQVELTDSGMLLSEGWQAVDTGDELSETWEVPVARRHLIGVERSGDGGYDVAWTWLALDEFWAEAADIEDLVLRRHRASLSAEATQTTEISEETLRAALDDSILEGSVGDEIVPALVAMLEQPSATDRATAAVSLGQLGPQGAVSVPALARALADEDVRVRFKSAGALWRIGPDASGAVSELAAALSDPDERVRSNAAGALRTLGAEAAPALDELRRLMDSGGEVMILAINIIEEMGETAAPAIPAIANLLEDPDPEVRRHAADALEELGVVASSAVPALTLAVADEDENVRANAIDALAEMGVEATAAVPVLIDATRDDDDDIRTRAIHALGRIGAGASAAVPALIDALADEDEDVRVGAATVLGQDMGGDTERILVALTAALEDDDREVRFEARKSIAAVRGR